MTGHGKCLTINARTADSESLGVLKAIASDLRLQILQELGSELYSINRLAERLNIPAVTVAMHIKVLEGAKLVNAELVPASRGLQKVCSRTYDQITISLPPLEPSDDQKIEVAMPIGAYVGVQAVPPCGLATETTFIGMIDDSSSFHEPERIGAQILWFRHGYVEYHFPYRMPPGARPTSVQVRMEICSEAPTHNVDCPSDITVWINGVEIGSWTSPGDFGGTRGVLTPAWWLDTDSQFGLHKRWEVTNSGSFVDGVQVSNVKLRDLNLGNSPVAVRLGSRADARNANGLNLFGRLFGNYPEDLVFRVQFDQ